MMQLLAVNRTVLGAKQVSGRYQMNRETVLPNFGSSGSIGSSPDCYSAFPPRVEPQTDDEPPSPAKPASGIADEGVKRKKPAAASEAQDVFIEDLTVRARQSGGKSYFTSRNTAKPNRRPVQCEIALDRIRVIRNDLKDTDFEVVPASGMEAPRPKAAASLDRNGGFWAKLTDKLAAFGRFEF